MGKIMWPSDRSLAEEAAEERRGPARETVRIDVEKLGKLIAEQTVEGWISQGYAKRLNNQNLVEFGEYWNELILAFPLDKDDVGDVAPIKVRVTVRIEEVE